MILLFVTLQLLCTKVIWRAIGHLFQQTPPPFTCLFKYLKVGQGGSFEDFQKARSGMLF